MCAMAARRRAGVDLAVRRRRRGVGAAHPGALGPVASRLLSWSYGRAKQPMPQPLAPLIAAWMPDATSVSVRVWRSVAGVPQGLFTFAGAIDIAVLRAVMQHVRRLTDAVPGVWTIEVIGSGLDSGLLHAVQEDLGALRRRGQRPRLAHAPRLRAEVRAALLASLAVAGEGPILLH